jgi:hypothetical protein
MSTIESTVLLEAIGELLREAYEGPVNPEGTWFIDNQPDAGLLALLEGVSAAEASTSVDGSGGAGSTIAANVEHLRWSLANANGAMRGEAYQPDWSTSWNLVRADEAEWGRLRQALRSEFETMRRALEAGPELHDDYLKGVLGLIPHAAYHLGIIRQMLERARG